MGWVEWRIHQYGQGDKVYGLEKICLEHAIPINLALHIAGTIPIIYGLWMHSLLFIVIGSFLSGVGHLYCRIIKDDWG